MQLEPTVRYMIAMTLKRYSAHVRIHCAEFVLTPMLPDDAIKFLVILSYT